MKSKTFAITTWKIGVEAKPDSWNGKACLNSGKCKVKMVSSCSLLTTTSNARFWVWVHILVNLVAMAFLFTMNLFLPWVLNFNLSQARLLKETACNYVFSVLVHGIPSISAWISIHQNSQKLFCAKTSIGH